MELWQILLVVLTSVQPAYSWFFLFTPFDNIPPNATEACSRLGAYSPESNMYPNTTEYATQSGGYWVIQNREILPSCRFAPRSAEDVAFAINTIRATESRFAVTSGRHSVVWGANDAQNGVTIDLNAHMRRVEIDQVNSIGRPSPARRGNFSHYGPHKGWASDKVLAMTVVLASGEIVRASSASHPNLYWALRGGGNRYGIVVEFELAAIRYENPLFAGSILLDSENLSEATRRLTVFNGKGSLEDDGATATMPFTCRQKTLTGLELASLPVGTSGLAHINVSTLPVNLFATNNESRYAQTVMTLSNNASVLEAAVDEFERLIQPLLAADRSLVAQAMYQPIPSAMFQHMTDSPLKLTDGPVFVFFLSLVWTDSSRDMRYESELREIHKWVEHRVRVLGGYRQWKYWNYAAGWQDVYQDYGDDALDRLFSVAETYDPDRVFYFLQSTSFDYF
ncbi:hypothetical protein INS49_004149 [Diaporthe citri]|uniref:uncharacterized protein n=1 Tax=Diaporthe citri TaxID=83186 RepID=UPI001C81359F|nr:uncharacterized protein INS49_004149 [Diaporthe citri]KAG6355068.1 hypothetical protein INS49_004149 [Diaporthe citri]